MSVELRVCNTSLFFLIWGFCFVFSDLICSCITSLSENRAGVHVRVAGQRSGWGRGFSSSQEALVIYNRTSVADDYCKLLFFFPVTVDRL